LDRAARLRREGEVALPLDVHRGALARFLVELDIAWFHVGGELVGLRLQVLGLPGVGLTLGEQERALLVQELVAGWTGPARPRRCLDRRLLDHFGRRLG